MRVTKGLIAVFAALVVLVIGVWAVGVFNVLDRSGYFAEKASGKAADVPSKQQVTIPSELVMEEYVFAQGKHSFRLPQIPSDSNGAKLLNRQIVAAFEDSIERAKEERGEYGRTYTANYTYAFKDGVLGIIVEQTVTSEYTGAGEEYKAFYYDFHTDSVLTFAQYLERFELTKHAVETALLDNATFQQHYAQGAEGYENRLVEDPCLLQDALVGEQEMTVYFFQNSPAGFASIAMPLA